MALDLMDTDVSQFQVRIENAFRALGRKSTLSLGKHMGEYFPFYYVVEYPKSGGTWLGKMCSTCLDVPFPQHPLLPIAFEAILHTHTGYEPRLKNVIYLIRDGRDVLLSFYFHRYRTLQTKYRNQTIKWMKQTYGKEIDMQDVQTYLPRFIESEMLTPSIITQNWPNHVQGWMNKPSVSLVKYEDLLTKPIEVLQYIHRELKGSEIDENIVHNIVERYSFKSMSGRKSGDENLKSFLRKGISGDWQNHFNKEAADIFNEYAGTVLFDTGYEQDKNWMEKLG